MKRLSTAWLILVASVSIAAAPRPGDAWVGSWASAQQTPEPRNVLPEAIAGDVTLRQIVRLSIGGTSMRVQISNAFGSEPLRIGAVHVAPAAGNSRIDAARDRTLTFDGLGEVVIPAGASYWSDPVTFDARPLSTVAVTMYLPDAPRGQTSHPGSRSTSYVVRGNQVGMADLKDATAIEHWYQLAGIEVAAPPRAGAIVTLGDSITDGHGATTNGNDRWPDRLADRLQATPAFKGLGVLNLGLGGNRLLHDGLGPNALARFDRDVLAQPGVRYLIVLEGINDLGTLTRDAPVEPAAHDVLIRQMIGVYRQIVARSRAAGIKVYGATILPDGASAYYHPDDRNEADRQAVNAWIRAPGNFDGVIDFDAITRDPKNPRQLHKAFDSGDGLHPSAEGYRAMAASIPLALFTRAHR